MDWLLNGFSKCERVFGEARVKQERLIGQERAAPVCSTTQSSILDVRWIRMD